MTEPKKLTRITEKEIDRRAKAHFAKYPDNYADDAIARTNFIEGVLMSRDAQLAHSQEEHDKAMEDERRATLEDDSVDAGLVEFGRKAMEDELVEWRNSRRSMFNRGNGLVIREKDGKDSDVIRFGPETALKIGLKAISGALKQGTLPEGIKAKEETAK